MGISERLESITEVERATVLEDINQQRTGEIERGAWENLFVSMERSFYNIVDLSATSIRKLSTFALEDEDVRKQTGAGWIGKNAGLLAVDFGKKAADPELAPETDPETMDKFAELLGTTVPYTAAAVAAAGVGFVAGGPVGAGAAFAKVGAGLASFSIMREEAYRNAIETGADEDTANIEANIVGGIQALIEIAQVGGILRQSKTGGVLLKSITMNARSKTWTKVLQAGGKLSMSMVRTMTEEALQEALQGTTSELVPKLLRGKEIEPGFAGRRLREAAGGALIGGVFGGIGSMAELATKKGEAAHIPNRPEIEFDDPNIETQAATEFEQPIETQQDIIDRYSNLFPEETPSGKKHPRITLRHSLGGLEGRTDRRTGAVEMAADFSKHPEKFERAVAHETAHEIFPHIFNKYSNAITRETDIDKETTILSIKEDADPQLVNAAKMVKSFYENPVTSYLKDVKKDSKDWTDTDFGHEALADAWAILQTGGRIEATARSVNPEGMALADKVYENEVSARQETEMTGPTSDIPSEGDIEFNEEVAEGETYSEAQIADAVVEGQEVEPVVEELSEPDTRSDVDISIDKLNDAISNRILGETRKLTEIERSQELGERVGKAQIVREKAISEGFTVAEAQREALKELSGEMAKAKFPPFTIEEMTPIDFENIRVAIINKGLQFFEETHALEAVNKLQDGVVPTESEMRDLGRVIGKESTEALISAAEGERSKLRSFIINLINFPTTTLASSEVSFIARQGLTTLTKWPKQWVSALNASYRSYFSSEWASMMQKDIQTRPNHQFRTSMGVDFLDLEGTDLTKTEERYMSAWAKKIPLFGALVKASERAAVVGMNKLRADIFDFVSEQWEGMDYPTTEYKRLAEIVNMSTGRGNITNKKIEAVLPFLNAALFSPRYGYSRFEMIGKGTKSLVNVVTGKATPSQKILASELVNFVIAGGLAMTLAAMMGAKVERDPRSSDFGKIVMGRTRIDVWAGFQQIARNTSQLITGKGKAVSSGEVFTKNRLETFGRFVQSKLSPIAGLSVELLSGKDFLGEPIPTFENKTDLAEWALYRKLAPLVLQDTVDAIKYSQNKGAAALSLPLAFHGIGVQTYETNALDDLTQMRDHYSTKVFGKEWKNIGPLSQDALREYKPQIVEQERVAKFERRNASFDVKRQREAGVTVEKSLPREVRREMDSVAVSLGGLSRTIVRNWRLNSDLYKKYQDDLSFLLNKVLPRVINKPGYQAQPPEVRQKILELIIKEAKSAVRKNIVLKANMKDIEDIREGVEQE